LLYDCHSPIIVFTKNIFLKAGRSIKHKKMVQ